MPILVTLPAGPPPPAGDQGGTTTPPASTGPLLRPQFTLIDTAGHVIALTSTGLNSGYVLMPGVTGHQMPPVAITSDPMPAQDGSVFRGIRYAERDLFLPIAIVAESPDEMMTLRRALNQLLSRRNGPVTCTVQHPNGEYRWVTGYYVDGGQGDEGDDQSGFFFEKRGLRFRCLDPWWYTDPRTQAWALSETADPFVSATDPFFPLGLASSTVTGQAVVNVDGDTQAEPIWDITGPGNSVTVSANGNSWQYTAALGSVDRIRVDARRFQQTVVDASSGANLFQNLAANPNLWLLEPGPNQVTVSMPGATSASQVRVTWSPRYETSG